MNHDEKASALKAIGSDGDANTCCAYSSSLRWDLRLRRQRRTKYNAMRLPMKMRPQKSIVMITGRGME